MELTPITKYGEFGLIEHLSKKFEIKHPGTVIGIGDDAAVLDAQNRGILVSTDMLVEKIHFDLSYTPLKHLGYKAVVVNVSDIYAMGAAAEQILVSLAVSSRFSVEALEELYEGIRLACNVYDVDLVGGDTSSSNSGLVLGITAIGYAALGSSVSRSGARSGDLLVVSGDLGGAYMGLQVLRRENEVFKVNSDAQPDLEPYKYIVERQLKPEARKDIPTLLAALGVVPTSMIDISDGLSSEALHIAKSSGVALQIYEEKIPKDPQTIAASDEFRIDSTTVALNGGEDYELLFTIRQSDYEKIKGNPNLTVIGYATEAERGSHLITALGEQIELKAQGFRHV